MERSPVRETPGAPSDERRGKRPPDRTRPRPARPPAGALPLAAPLERDAAPEQPEQHQQQRQVERREHRRVPQRKRREQRRSGDDQPYLVAIPPGTDRVDRHPALGLVAPD